MCCCAGFVVPRRTPKAGHWRLVRGLTSALLAAAVLLTKRQFLSRLIVVHFDKVSTAWGLSCYLVLMIGDCGFVLLPCCSPDGFVASSSCNPSLPAHHAIEGGELCERTVCSQSVFSVCPRFCSAVVLSVGWFAGWPEVLPRWRVVAGVFLRLGRGFASLSWRRRGVPSVCPRFCPAGGVCLGCSIGSAEVLPL